MDGHDPKKEGSKSFITADKKDLKSLEFAFNFKRDKISEIIFLSSFDKLPKIYRLFDILSLTYL